MKILINTSSAAALIAKILKDSKNGELATWDYRSNDDDEFITHSPVQWGR